MKIFLSFFVRNYNNDTTIYCIFGYMTLTEAFEEFLNSKEFKDVAKNTEVPDGSRYRQIKKRYKDNGLGKSAMIDILEANGYIINVTKAKKIKVKSPQK